MLMLVVLEIKLIFWNVYFYLIHMTLYASLNILTEDNKDSLYLIGGKNYKLFKYDK